MNDEWRGEDSEVGLASVVRFDTDADVGSDLLRKKYPRREPREEEANNPCTGRDEDLCQSLNNVHILPAKKKWANFFSDFDME